MSTKIYDAFVLDMSITKAISLLKDCIEDLNSSVKAKLETGMYDTLYEMALNAALAGLSGEELQKAFFPYTAKREMAENIFFQMGEDPLFGIWLLARSWVDHNEVVSRSFDVNDKFNVLLNVSLFPSGKKTYGMAFGNSDLIAMLLKRPEFHDYSYWNNVDRPQDISPQAWGARRRIWDKMLPTGLPIRDGVQYVLFPTVVMQYPLLTDEAMGKYVEANREKYVQREARHKLVELILEGKKEFSVTQYLDAEQKAKVELSEKTQRATVCLEAIDRRAPRSWEECKEILAKAFDDQNRKAGG